MKLFAATVALAHANPSVKCNDGDGKVVMTATVPKADVQRNLADSADWNEVGGNYVATWSSFDGDGFTVEQAERKDTKGNAYQALVISKSVDSQGCKQENVDGVNVCVKTGHTLDFECAYSLEDQTLNTADFTVSGSDTEKSATNTGKLNYTLEVNTGMKIGDKAAATITPKTAGLVVATVNTCKVSHDHDSNAANPDSSVKLFDSNEVPSPNPLGVSIATGSGKDVLEFGWSSFKWTTTKKNGNDVEEVQKLTCEIGLALPPPPKVKTWKVSKTGARCGEAGEGELEYEYVASELACKEKCENHADCWAIAEGEDPSLGGVNNHQCALFSKQGCDDYGYYYDNLYDLHIFD